VPTFCPSPTPGARLLAIAHAVAPRSDAMRKGRALRGGSSGRSPSREGRAHLLGPESCPGALCGCRARPPAPAGGNWRHMRPPCGGGRAPSLQVTRVPCTGRAVGVRHGQAGSRTAGRGSSAWPGPLKAKNRAPGPRPPRVRQRSSAAGELLPF